MTEQFVVGGSTYPLATGTGNSLLRDSDPTLFLAIDYFSFCITNYLGTRIVTEASAIGAPITSAVAYVLPYDPLPFLREVGITFPLLAIWRTKEKYKWLVNAYTDRTGDWQCAYVLPPLTAGQTERCRPLLASIGPVLNARIENMGDPGYTLPSSFAGNGNNVWAATGVEEIYLDEAVIGAYQASDQQQMFFPAWTGTLKVKERDMPKPDAAFSGGPFAGFDVEIDDVTDDSPPLVVVQEAINFPDVTTLGGGGTIVGLYRGDAGVTAGTDASLVGAIADQSAAAHNLTAPGTQPSLLTDEVSRQKIVRFDGASSYLTSGAIASLGNDNGKTVVVLFRLWDTISRSSIALITSGATAGTVSIDANTLSSAGGKFGLYAAGSSFDTQFTTDSGWHVAVLRITSSTSGTSVASSVSLTIDGVTAQLTLKSGTGNWQTLASSTLVAAGGLTSALATTTAHADVAVLFAYSVALSATDAASAITFCNEWLARAA